MSNSNFNITKVVVDPISQEISSLEVNGKPIETGGGNLQTIVYDSQYPLDVSALFPPSSVEPGEVCIEPDTELGYDGIEKVTILADGLTGYPETQLPTYLYAETLIQCDQDGNDIEDPETIDVYAFISDDSELADRIDAMYLKNGSTSMLMTYNTIRINNPGYRPDHFYIYQYNDKYYKV